MLEYENEMFLSCLQEDGLTISAKGLGLEQVFLSLLKVYCDPGNLVLVLGCSEQEENWFTQELLKQGEKNVPKKVTTDISTQEREIVYLEGGVLFITTRILVVDFLMDRIPSHLITGIIVNKAHRIMESCQESFILRLYRQKNKKGFIKAFSSSPVSFSQGFCQVERVMKNLFVRHLHLWPRFHSTVASVLSTHQPEVVELQLEMTPKMQDVQASVLDLISFTLKEIKRLNPSMVDREELTVENCVSKSFHKSLQRELLPIWHQLSFKTKQLISDLKTLHLVLSYLTQYDCITFYNFVATLKTAESAMRSGGWVLLDEAETLFLSAQARVFSALSLESNPQGGKQIARGKGKEAKFEENPKWTEIGNIIKEIKAELTEAGLENAFPSEKVLVVTRDVRTLNQVRDYISVGPKKLLARMFNKCLGEKYGYVGDEEDLLRPQDEPVKSIKHKGVGKKSSNNGKGTEEEVCVSMALTSEESCVKTVESPITLLHALDNCETSDTMVLLQEMKPRYIIVYDCDMTLIRQIEVYQASYPKVHTRVYFMLYKGSVEEQVRIIFFI